MSPTVAAFAGFVWPNIDVHQHFIDAVLDGRGDRRKSDEDLFNGLIWSGQRAIDLGLVDSYGSTDSVARAGGAEDLKDFTQGRHWIDRISERIGASFAMTLQSTLGGGYRLQ